VQQELGWVSPESEKVVADYLGMAPMAVHEVTTFYNMYNQKKIGQVQTERLHQFALPVAWWSTSLGPLAKTFGHSVGRNNT